MERDPILSAVPPTDVDQPLFAPVNLTENDSKDKDGGIGLRTLSRIPTGFIPEHNNTDEPNFIQPVEILPTSSSIQADIVQGTSDESEIPIDYQSLADDDQSAVLYDFLASLGITRQLIDHAKIPEAALLKLYQQEFSCLSWMKWSSLDHAIEKNLQWLLLSPSDVGSGPKQKCDYRVRPHGRTILLKSTWGLIKAYAVRGFVQGVEMGLLESVHYFIYAMLAYRLIELAKNGQSDFEEFQGIFSGSNQKGIDSLVRSLSGLEAKWLKLILAAPFIFGFIQGIIRIPSACRARVEDIQKTTDKVQSHIEQPRGWLRDVILEKTPLLSIFTSYTIQVQKLEQWVRWDGRLGIANRQTVFELIRQVAYKGKKITQLNALESLAKIAHGIGLKDFRRLQRVGYSSEELTALLYIKTTALADLEILSQRKLVEEKILLSSKEIRLFASLPRRLYTSYLLWWLGQSASWWTQRLPFSLLKTLKLGLEALFLREIMASILEAINCPDKPGFQFGKGYAPWASEYTSDCFASRLGLFRSIDTNESIDDLIAEIPRYHLADFTWLDLASKYLTSEEASKILPAIVKQGAPLQLIYLNNNNLTNLTAGIFEGLSQLQILYLRFNPLVSLSKNIFFGLEKLQVLYLDHLELSDLSMGVFSPLNQLQSLYLNDNRLNFLSAGIFLGLSKLQNLFLSNNLLSSLNLNVLIDLPQLQFLDVHGNQINISMLMSLLNALPPYIMKLNIANNSIDYLPENFIDILPKTIQSLTIGGNFIPKVLTAEVMLRYFPSTLIGLGISSSPINSIVNDTFSDFSNLTYLDLSNNQLDNNGLSDQVFSILGQLQTLY
ncbi:MAG: leucine-rich repeat domain-containing protein, partial [Proteobacteria bacterium]|nr:leucine-rich repeat domain-containing protein [Pseudomonadota bacterium]